MNRNNQIVNALGSKLNPQPLTGVNPAKKNQLEGVKNE